MPVETGPQIKRLYEVALLLEDLWQALTFRVDPTLLKLLSIQAAYTIPCFPVAGQLQWLCPHPLPDLCEVGRIYGDSSAAAKTVTHS